MHFIYTRVFLQMEHLNNVGSKAKNLQLLKKTFRVPNFEILDATKIDTFLKRIGISSAIKKDAFNSKKNKRDEIRDTLRKNTYVLNKDFSKLNYYLIVRSAAIGEDGSSSSFAGIYESKKTVNNKTDLEKTITELIIAAFSERVYWYARQKGFKEFPKISFIIQNYVDADYGGVCFSTTKKNGTSGTLIEANKGNAEQVVLGRKCETIFIEKNIPKSKIPKLILEEVFKASKQIEKIFQQPQDIEWCSKNNQIYILQARPITTSLENELIVWDSSNIAESYSGIVLPLTCSFAQFVYARVYRDVARNSNISDKIISKNAKMFDNLLGFHYGRFYYNMNNWYKMLTLFPGYERNKENLDMMISARNKLELDASFKNNVSTSDKIKYYLHIGRRMLIFEKELKGFQKEIRNYLDKIRFKDLSPLSLKELWKEFESYQVNLLNKWSITVDNDFLAMTWFGIYNKITLKKGFSEQDTIKNITDLNSVISAQQVIHLSKLSREVFKEKQFLKLAKKKQWYKCFKEVKNHPILSKKINSYLLTYGGRFANELKLEAKDLDSDPAYLIELLYYYYYNFKTEALSSNKSAKSKDLLTRFTAKKAKHYLRHREENRLLRSQAFSFARKLFLEIGLKLSKDRIIVEPEDVFYLTLDEVKEGIENNIDKRNIIKKRKKEYSSYESVELEPVLIASEGETPLSRTAKTIKSSNQLQGVACSPGVVKGKIRVMNTFELPNEQIDIAVVKHTDPGWTPLFGVCKGLIVEHGGLLSHAAIISRELGLPCIIGVENATQLLKDNQVVEMNANNGNINVIKK